MRFLICFLLMLGFFLSLGFSSESDSKKVDETAQEFVQKIETEEVFHRELMDLIFSSPQELKEDFEKYLMERNTSQQLEQETIRRLAKILYFTIDNCNESLKSQACKENPIGTKWVQGLEKKFPLSYLKTHERDVSSLVMYFWISRREECSQKARTDLILAVIDYERYCRTWFQHWTNFKKTLSKPQQKKHKNYFSKIDQFEKKLHRDSWIDLFWLPNIHQNQTRAEFAPKEIREFLEKQKDFSKPFDPKEGLKKLHEDLEKN